MNCCRLALALVLAVAAVAAQAQAQERQKTVVELFTSQGCASCPPADALLNELANDPQVIALTLAVDYWDYIGWKDTLALHGHSVRQKAYADQRADRKVFTPQVVVGGTQYAKGSDRAAVQRALMAVRGEAAQRAVPVSLSRRGDSIAVEVGNSGEPIPEPAELWACPVASSRSVAIGRGENGGRQITYANVVRGWVRIGSFDGRPGRYSIPVESLRHDGADTVVVLLQSGSFAQPGPILGAASLPLE